MPQSRLLRSIIAGTAILTLAACSAPTEPEWRIEPGRLLAITAPDTVPVGTSFIAVVTTYGSPGCTRSAGAQLALVDLRATIVPMDSVFTNTSCVAISQDFHRNVRLTFHTVGQAILTARGRSGYVAGDTTIRRTVDVR